MFLLYFLASVGKKVCILGWGCGWGWGGASGTSRPWTLSRVLFGNMKPEVEKNPQPRHILASTSITWGRDPDTCWYLRRDVDPRVDIYQSYVLWPSFHSPCFIALTGGASQEQESFCKRGESFFLP